MRCRRMLIVLSLATPAWAASEAPKTLSRERQMAIVAAARNVAREEDTFAALEYLHANADARQVVGLYSMLAGGTYWKDKDLPRAVAFLRGGIQHCLRQAQLADGSDPAAAGRFRGAAKAMAYNLGSFTWPGWGEKSIEVTRADQAVGCDAARCTLRLARELKQDDKPLANAHWLVGAWQLAREEYDAAAESFERTRTHANNANDAALELMARGYAAVTKILAGQDAPAERKKLDEVVAALKKLGTEDAKIYAPQFATVLKVFGK